MSRGRVRGTFIRERIMDQALFGSEGIFNRFEILYALVGFVDSGTGLLKDHPKTGDSAQEFIETNPVAARTFMEAEARWTAYIQKRRQEIKLKMEVERQ